MDERALILLLDRAADSMRGMIQSGAGGSGDIELLEEIINAVSKERAEK